MRSLYCHEAARLVQLLHADSIEVAEFKSAQVERSPALSIWLEIWRASPHPPPDGCIHGPTVFSVLLRRRDHAWWATWTEVGSNRDSPWQRILDADLQCWADRVREWGQPWSEEMDQQWRKDVGGA